ncbi:MAG: hypothetical protein AAF491_04105 [Verrucomicrobiota bacterium]
MELQFTPLRLGLFLLLIGIFNFLGVFSVQSLLAEAGAQNGNAMKAWSLCVALFVIGSAFLTIVNHSIGLVHPVNLRPVYVMIGLVLIVISLLWVVALRTTWKGQLGW